MRIGAVFFGAWLGCMVYTGWVLAERVEVQEALEGALCRKLATDYANKPSSLTVQAIAQLQICLAQTLGDTASAAISKTFDRHSPRPSTGIVDATLPTPPTPPTPPKPLKIP